MSNMSYCAFENTLGDLRDCLELLDEAGSIEEYENDCNEYEKPCIRGLVEMCAEFVERYGEETK